MGRRVAFSVDGKPARWMRPAQGFNPKTGKVMRFTDKTAQATKDNIAAHARRAWGSEDPAWGPVLVRVVAVFEVPSSWPKKVKQAALEGRVMHTQDPDLDQLVKQVKDALVGIAYIDDNQVCGYPNSAKRFGHPARTEVTIQVLDPAPDEITPSDRRTVKLALKRGIMRKDPFAAEKEPQLFPRNTKSDEAQQRSKDA